MKNGWHRSGATRPGPPGRLRLGHAERGGRYRSAGIEPILLRAGEQPQRRSGLRIFAYPIPQEAFEETVKIPAALRSQGNCRHGSTPFTAGHASNIAGDPIVAHTLSMRHVSMSAQPWVTRSVFMLPNRFRRLVWFSSLPSSALPSSGLPSSARRCPPSPRDRQANVCGWHRRCASWQPG